MKKKRILAVFLAASLCTGCGAPGNKSGREQSSVSKYVEEEIQKQLADEAAKAEEETAKQNEAEEKAAAEKTEKEKKEKARAAVREEERKEQEEAEKEARKQEEERKAQEEKEAAERAEAERLAQEQANADARIQEARQAELNVVSGVLTVCDADTLLAIQGHANDNVREYLSLDDRIFYILQLDQTYSIDLMGGDGSPCYDRTCTLIDLCAIDSTQLSSGDTVVISFGMNDGSFPSDVSLPLGEPALSNYTVLSVTHP